LDEILGQRRNVSPLPLVELVLAVLDVIEEVELAEVAGAALGPTARVTAVTGEGRVPAQQDVHHHPQAPQVTPLVVLEVVLGVIDESLDDLRSHELGAADRSTEQRRRVGAASRVELDAGPEVKVTELHRSKSVIVHTKHILGLQIPVRDSFGVEELQS